MSRVRIKLRYGERARVIREVLEALAATQRIFNRGVEIVQVYPQESGVSFHKVTTGQLGTLIDGHIELVRGDPESVARVPAWLPTALIEDPVLAPLPKLNGVTTLPLLRSDGTLVTEGGFDQETGVYFAPEFEPQGFVKVEGTRSLRAQWKDLFEESFGQFPWYSKQDRAAYTALIVSLIARVSLSGPFPMFVLSGCQLGTGKTLLCDVANVIAHGRSLARRIYPARPEDLEKLLDAALLGGDEVVCFDNVDQPLHGAPLDALLTATDGKKIRRMHSHQEILIEHRPVMIANGNWVRVHGDTSRRVLRFGLKAYGHGADRRGDLKISDLRKHLGERRKQWIVLVVKALRLALKIDRSKWKTTNWGSFEGFCAVLEATHKLTGTMLQPSARVFQERLHRVLDGAGFERVWVGGRHVRYLVFHSLRHTFACLRQIKEAAQNGDWRAAAWMLERRYPEKWGRRRRVSLCEPVTS